VFNEHTVGRSGKCDVVVAVLPPPGAAAAAAAPGAAAKKNSKKKAANLDAHELNDLAYTLVSNKHARIYCLQTAPSRTIGSHTNHIYGTRHPPPHSHATTMTAARGRSYETYIEDTSNNGTVVGGTLLRRGERRLLNSGAWRGVA
jgi:hypothetical protein